jgi:nicotinate phosphoribosyltransferase
MTAIPQRLELLTDLYELTMAASYFENRMAESATFSLFIRKYPPHRAYFVAAGLEDVLEHVANFRFSQGDISFLEDTGLFSKDFLHYLSALRFTGEIRAIPEGEVFFADEPILELTGPIIEAQLLETLIINTIQVQSMAATKAARCVHAAGDRGLVDFSLRRTHGADAGLRVARSSYIAGFVATSNVMAGKVYHIPIAGTMAHSYVSSFKSEIEAFRAFARSFPKKSIFLIDTYNTIEGARKAAIVGQEMAKKGEKLLGVRLDSGDMISLSQEVRKILDEAGLEGTEIFASGSFDEYQMAEVIRQGAKIDAFGIGTKMGVSADAPYLDIVYKLVQYGERSIMKLSTGKVNLPGEKQIFRKTDSQGLFMEDMIGTPDEAMEGRYPLLEPAMNGGRLLRAHPSLEDIRKRFKESFRALDERYKALIEPSRYPVRPSPHLEDLQAAASQGSSGSL